MAKVNNAHGPVLIDFYADSCGLCKIQGKILHDMEQGAEKSGTLMMVKDGRIVNRQSGVADKRKLTQWMQ